MGGWVVFERLMPEKYRRLRERKEMNVGEDIGVDSDDGEGRG